MRVLGCGVSTSPKAPGFFLRYGDVCDPQDGEQLNGPPWPTRARRFFIHPAIPFFGVPTALMVIMWLCSMTTWWCVLLLTLLPLIPGVFVCVNIKGHGIYAGWKCYGFDSPTYASWCGGKFAGEVFQGSLALELTVRTFNDG